MNWMMILSSSAAASAAACTGCASSSGSGLLTTVLIPLGSAALGALLGGYLSRIQSREDAAKKQAHAASMLYYDLIRMEHYFITYDKTFHQVPMRSTEKWEELIAECSFLSSSHVRIIYEIYDTAYFYQQTYEEAEYLEREKGYQPSYARGMYDFHQLRKLLWKDISKDTYLTEAHPHTESYQEVLNLLKEKAQLS